MSLRTHAAFALLLLVTPLAAQKAKPAPAAGPTSTTLEEAAQKRYRARYAFRELTPGTWTANGPDQGLLFEVSPEELRVSPTSGAPFTLSARCTAFGRSGGMTSLASPVITAHSNRVELAFGSTFSCWYVNESRGLEQGWTFASRPAGDPAQPVRIELAFEGDLSFVLGASARDGVFVDGTGAVRVGVRGLAVSDANGRALDAWFEATGSGLGVELGIDDRSAAYPITVDPFLTGPVWTATGVQMNEELGQSVASAGDVNGDGFADVIVGAPGFTNGQSKEGAAFVYLGSAQGLASVPAWSIEGNHVDAELGAAVASAGDVNGDGYDDVIVGAPTFNSVRLIVGKAEVYLGSANGLATTPAWTAEGSIFCQMLGSSVASAGDVNGDGFDDVVVGAPGEGSLASYRGTAYLYLGSASGLSSSPDWSASAMQPDTGFGHAVAGAGDVNGDGYDDVVVGAPTFDDVGTVDSGVAVLYLGSPGGLHTSADWSFFGEQAGEELGTAVASAGDVDGDGFDDLLVGAPRFDAVAMDVGRALLFTGSVLGPGTSPEWTQEGGSELGSSLSSAGDVDGDGFDDVLIGGSGQVLVFGGSILGLETSSEWGASVSGTSVASAGDVDGDGLQEVIVGVPGWSVGGFQTHEGEAVVYTAGRPAGSPFAGQPSWSVLSLQAQSQFAYSVSDAGDVNGDGFGDVIVGAPSENAGQSLEGRAYVYPGSAGGLALAPVWIAESNQAQANFGRSVSSAGDVNGDGYDDVIVGAPRFSSGFSHEGRAFLYLGSATGLALAPAWVADGGQASASFGASVSSAGDVNGDGYDDVIVGAPDFDAGEADEGRAFLYFGSSTGLAPTAVWTAESNQTGARFGFSVSLAGDVDADAFSDVIVGAPYYSGGESTEGRASMYRGSAAGLALAPTWIFEGNQTAANLGWSVSSAGDVNGDGFDDVVVGAPGTNQGFSKVEAGRAFVFLGRSTGLSGPFWSPFGTQSREFFGSSVSSAGDVTGDGYDDVIIGAFMLGASEGAVFAFLGSSSGLNSKQAWSLQGGGPSRFLGTSVSSAGDVNGDELDDIIVGAPGLPVAGRALLFLAIPLP